MNEKKQEEKNITKKKKYVPPKTTKHDPVDVVCGSCKAEKKGGECSLYYTY